MGSDAERLLQRAVRRDLGRARLLLSTSRFLARERRRALVRHLLWLAGLLRSSDPELCRTLAGLGDAARAFRDRGDPAERRALLAEVIRLAGLLARGGDWVGPSAIAAAGHDVHWLVDGLDAGSCEHVTRSLAPRTTPLHRRQRADVYRVRKTLLWGGTPAYGVPRQRAGA